jgi:hypothetical protein
MGRATLDATWLIFMTPHCNLVWLELDGQVKLCGQGLKERRFMERIAMLLFLHHPQLAGPDKAFGPC